MTVCVTICLFKVVSDIKNAHKLEVLEITDMIYGSTSTSLPTDTKHLHITRCYKRSKTLQVTWKSQMIYKKYINSNNQLQVNEFVVSS
jgi:hypothetical protein